MPHGFLDLAYLVEISIVFNLAYREIKPLFDKRQIQDKIQQITNRKELKNTIEYCQNNPDKLAEGAVTIAYKQFISSEESLYEKMNGLYLTKWINFCIIIVLSILLFATTYPHLPPIQYIATYSKEIWWLLFLVLVISVIFPAVLTHLSNKKIKEMYQELERYLDQFTKKYNQYLAEKAKNKDWNQDTKKNHIANHSNVLIIYCTQKPHHKKNEF